jgi:hypothetical protein
MMHFSQIVFPGTTVTCQWGMGQNGLIYNDVAHFFLVGLGMRLRHG